MASTPPNSSIPTLSLLYKLRKLAPASQVSLAPNATPVHNNRIGLIRGDITTLHVDAIVNAANTRLLGGGGVDGAIHRAAGPGLLAECRKLRGCATGSAKITDAYELPCKKVIHAVGPIYDDDDVEECEKELEGCYKTSLQLAVQNGLKTIAFSGISTGIYGYPSRAAATVACRTVKTFLDGEEGKKLDTVVFVTFEQKDVASYNMILPRFFPPKTTKEQQEEADQQTAEAEAMASKLPDVPKTDPADPEHALKRQKHESDN